MFWIFRRRPSKEDVTELVKRASERAAKYTANIISKECFERETLDDINRFLLEFGK